MSQCTSCNSDKCCCPKVITKTGLQGPKGATGAPGVAGAGFVGKGTLSAPPSSPQNNWYYNDTTLNATRVYNTGAWNNLAVNGTNGTNGANGTNGTNGTNGVSANFTGNVTSLPGSPELNQVVRLTTAEPPQSEVWNGTTWVIVAKDGAAGTNGTNGTNGSPGTNGTNGTNGINGTNGTNGRDGNGWLFASLTLTSGQIKTLNSAPLEIVSATTNGFAIEVISGSVNFVYGATPYTGGTKIQLKTSTATLHQVETYAGLITSTSTKFVKMVVPASNNTQIVNQQNLVVTADADSAAGDSTCTVYVCYRIITI